ncbi:MAG: WYL domain-containing protein [Paenibacillaceae bacterium]|nr:WYL domain-containing protein [Paenibacillaceae bacterium]
MIRIVKIYESLRSGPVRTEDVMERHNVSRDTVQKDMQYIREALGDDSQVVYDKSNKVYRMASGEDRVFHSLLLLTMLYGSRSLSKHDLEPLKTIIFGLLTADERKAMKKITDTYDLHYVPMTEQSSLFAVFHDLYRSIRQQKVIRMTYTTSSQETKEYAIAPISIVYDEGFFYAIAYVRYDTDSPGVRNFRIDRIGRYRVTANQFVKPQHADNFFEGGKHANLSYLMHSGDKTIHATVKVEPWLGHYLRSKFPLHQLLRKEGERDVYRITVSHEQSLLFWLLQQRTWAEVLSPASLRETIKQEIRAMAAMYE